MNLNCKDLLFLDSITHILVDEQGQYIAIRGKGKAGDFHNARTTAN